MLTLFCELSYYNNSAKNYNIHYYFISSSRITKTKIILKIRAEKLWLGHFTYKYLFLFY